MEGTLDTSFNPPAITGNNWVPFGGVQSSGKVLVALNGSGGQNGTIGAETNSGLIRLNEDGSLTTDAYIEHCNVKARQFVTPWEVAP